MYCGTRIRYARPNSTVASASPAIQPSERLVALDVLRGLALLGMFFVHFNDNSIEPSGGPGLAYRRFVELFFQTQFWTMFAILFGAGFGVQLRRAGSDERSFILRYGRRLAALAVFGAVAEIFFGYWVLLGYAIWGIPLLLVRRWSNRALVIALVVCASSIPLYSVTRAVYFQAIGKPELDAVWRRAANEQDATALNEFQATQRASDYRTAVSGRLRYMPHKYSQRVFILPTNEFTLFLIGFLALRLGLFDQPQRHTRLIVSVVIFGVLSWATSHWLLPFTITSTPPTWLPLRVATLTAGNAFRLIRDSWLALTYIGAILLLVSRPGWQRGLSVFSITGRMALTNYMLQVVILDLTFSNYAFGAQISAWLSPVAALALFGAELAFGRWWLSRFSYGPLEWLWRSATYARWEQIRHLPAPKAA